MGYAYFCARCVSVKADPADAERFALSLGLKLWNPGHEVTFDFPEGALACREAIDAAAAVICQPPIGNDCSWELGYAAGIGKKIYVIGELSPDDWMTKIDVTYVKPAELESSPAARAEISGPPPSAVLHPFAKSLANYIRVGYRYATGEDPAPGLMDKLRDVSLMDTSVLVVDDILDNSRERAQRPCLYRERGVNAALVEALLMSSRSVEALGEIASALGTSPAHQVRLYALMNAFIADMYTGQRLDLEAREDTAYHPAMIDRYLRIISLITASHVRLGFECGQLLAATYPDDAFSRAGNAVGMVRQMLDDFNDYFDDHHEPFGDFKGGLNRLPEILFKQAGGSRAAVLAALASKDTAAARDLVLTGSVRSTIHTYCSAQLSRLAAVDSPVDLAQLAGDIQPVLSRRD